MSVMLSHALAWAERGFRVFPCVPRTKVPKADAFYDVATRDPEQVKRLWWNENTQSYGDYNVGVSTDDLIVTDVDIKDGRDGTQGFIELGGDPNTLAVRTPSGGIHYYYLGDPARNRVNIATGVDIRSHHGYVLAPGSHFVDAKKGVDGYYTLLNDVMPALVPDGIASRLTAPRSTVARADVNIVYDDPQAMSEAEDYLKYTALPSIEGLGGNGNAYAVAARVVNDLAILPDTAALLMLEHWNDRCQPPWEMDDLYRFANNAAMYSTGTQGSKRADVVFGEVAILPTIMEMPARERGLYFGNLPDAHMIPPRPWLYNKLALRKEITTIVAEGAGGKSTLAVLIAAHAALGMAFGPFDLAVPGVPQRVLVHDDENSREEQSRILLAICSEYRLDYAIVKANIIFWTKDDPKLVLARAEGQQVVVHDQNCTLIVDLMLDRKVDMFMLNPLVNLHNCNENDNTQMKAVMNVITQIASETNTAGIVFHHSSKGSSGVGKTAAGNSEISRGAGAIINASRIALTLTTASQADKEAIGLRDDKQYTRVDDAKSNVFAKNAADSAKLWFRWTGIRIPSGDVMGVPILHDIQVTQNSVDEVIVSTIDVILTRANAGRVAYKTLLTALAEESPMLSPMGEKNLRARIDRMAMAAVHAKLPDGRSVRVVKEVAENGGVSISLA